MKGQRIDEKVLEEVLNIRINNGGDKLRETKHHLKCLHTFKSSGQCACILPRDKDMDSWCQ